MARKIYSEWLGQYYELTEAGRREATLRKHIIRGSIIGAIQGYRYGEVQVLGYFRKYKKQPRNLNQIWSGMEFGVTRAEMIRGVNRLVRKGLLKRA